MAHISDDTVQMVQEYYPNLRDQSKAERTAILTEKRAMLKEKVQGSLRELQKKPLNMEVKGKLLRVELYEKGIQKATKDLTAKKAAVLLQLEDVLKNARYLYSTPDYNRNSNVYRRNYFCTPVQMEDEKYVAEIIVADNRVTKESQVVEMNLNRGTPLDGGRMGKAAGPTGVSSGVPDYSIVTSPLAVNREADNVEIKRDATLGGGGDGKPAGRSGASSVASKESIFGFLPNVNGVNLADQYAWQMPMWPVGNLASPVQTQAEVLRQVEAVRAQYRKELEEAELERAFLRGFNMEE